MKKKKDTGRVGICPPEEVAKINRRQLLSTGVSMSAYLSTPSIFNNVVCAQGTYPVQRRLVWISLTGGWDILEATDPKASSTSGIDMSYSWDQANTVSGSSFKIGRFLPRIAGIGNDLLVVRGLAMGTTSHDAGRVYMDTGVLSNAGNVNAASIPSIVASESSATIPIIQLEGGNEPLTDRGLLNPVSVVRANNLELYRSLYPANDTEKQLRLRMLDYLQTSVTRLSGSTGSNDRLTSVSTAESKIRNQINADVGDKLLLNDGDLTNFTNGAPENLDDGVARSFALASKLIKNDLVSCVNLGIGGWDTHANQEAAIQPRLETLDFVVRALTDDLRSAGKLNDTLIVLYSDFGRTPKINGRNGRDHWPVGGSMIIGGNLDGGRVVGDTNDNLLAQSVNTTTGEVDSSGTQLNPTHIGGSVLELTLGTDYMQFRTYLESVAAITRTKT